MTGRYAIIFRSWIPVLLWAAAVFWLSSIPGNDIPDIEIPFADKLIHFSEYFILGLLTLRAGVRSFPNINLAKLIVLFIIILSLYAALDEWHQNFIPGRTADIKDLIVDIIGAGAGMILYKRRVRSCRE
ncbi:MAG: VanZ family protein [Candidatus Omnitrophica bacterium]|nr:VanZ family protein [Candidatus Omnitrophota bacterium]